MTALTLTRDRIRPKATGADPGGAEFLRRLLAANDSTQALQVAVDFVVLKLDCPVSWAGMVADDYLVMGAHCGVHSSEMASAWRLRVGEGIGGRVAAERKSHMSRDYRHDSRRVPLMKRLIDNEGIQATLTVPLLMGDAALGVLYAAHRHPYPWTDAEQLELESIGQDLALRLRQLDVDGRRRQQAEKARHEYERALHGQAVLSSVAFALGKQEDLGASLDVMAQEIGVLLELRYVDGQLLCAAGEHGAGNPRVVFRRDLPDASGLTLQAVHVRDLDEVSSATLDLACGLVRLQFLRLHEREWARERFTGEVLDQLFGGHVSDGASLRLRMVTMGIPLEQSQVVVLGQRDGRNAADGLQQALSDAFPSSVLVQRAGRAVVIVGNCAPQEVKERLRAVLAGLGRTQLVAGIGCMCGPLGDYAMSYDQARAACELGLRTPSAPPVLTAHDLGIVPLASVPLPQLHTMVRDALGPLIEVDSERGSDLVQTLRVHLGNDRHLATTAAALHVHYNTVRNRIARIEELLGVDLRNVEDRFRLETAVRMHSLTSALTTADAVVTA